MIISKQVPPIYATIKKVLNVNWEKGICIVYEEWWRKYLDDKKFRLEQEIEAYRNQVQWIKANSSREYKRFIVNQTAKDLSSGLYGNLCTYLEAKHHIDKPL